MALRWAATATEHLVVRLEPGADLRLALEEVFDGTGATAGFVVACVGSLTSAELRMAGEDGVTRVPGPLEIVSLSGTFGPDGPHLHMAVSDAQGAMRGGHLLAGCDVRTTAEMVLALTGAVVFHRKRDLKTGYAELAPEKAGTGGA